MFVSALRRANCCLETGQLNNTEGSECELQLEMRAKRNFPYGLPMHHYNMERTGFIKNISFMNRTCNCDVSFFVYKSIHEWNKQKCS